MKENIIRIKSYEFAVRIVKFYKYLINEKKEIVLSKQVLRAGTSIGANVEEALGAQSKNDFISKMSIAYKEARETHYWIRLLYDSEYISLKEKESIINECEELLKIIASIQKTIKSNNS